MEAHEGDISVKSEKREGSIFTMRMPKYSEKEKLDSESQGRPNQYSKTYNESNHNQHL